jgi:hypothetical protein
MMIFISVNSVMLTIVWFIYQCFVMMWLFLYVVHHPEFNTQAKRMGAVIRISQIGIHL